jgi:Domain of unknown function (DUF4351)
VIFDTGARKRESLFPVYSSSDFLHHASRKAMSQFPHDRFNKNLFELRLSPFGEVSTQRPLDPETTFIDIYFVPQQPIAPEPQLSLLAKCINDQAVVFEPYRNPVEVNKIQGCIIKALQIQQEVCPEPDPQVELHPRMWIITPTLAAHKLELFSALADEAKWGKGIYLLGKGLQTGVIVVHQLPVTVETLLFRLMGKGGAQQAAMAEVTALPVEHPYRQSLLKLLVSYRMELAAKQDAETDEQELVMQLSPLYLEQLEAARLDGERQGEQRGEQIGELNGRQNLVLKLLVRRVGKISVKVERQVRSLSTEQLDLLGEALLDFESMSNLLTWLQGNEV